MADIFSTFKTSLNTPAFNGQQITNDVDFGNTSRAIFVGSGGNLVVMMAGGNQLTFNNVADSTLLPIRATRVVNSGTTATNLVALW